MTTPDSTYPITYSDCNSGRHFTEPHRSLSEDQLPLLITGIAGVSGFNAFHYFRKKFGDQVIGLRTVNNWPLCGEQIIACNVEEEEAFQNVIDQYQIRTILNCGGSCALKACELDPEMAEKVNVHGIRSLLKAIEGTDIQLLHLSIDLVFSGTGNGNHLEILPTEFCL